ncbi:hypothetical protein EPIR_2542 [Erwinia piriflorinigrans CFBP 5888]|uniref:Uncharacterized protein n=1 Tax=Erwinia piriflorinigrans CFBP 5888 TaxID=1161919 RepID=V5ZAE9_9GAMM|nr:hypothetical protein EPIR_2542 [Erwinia piriflorinigrans CFBP 5888]
MPQDSVDRFIKDEQALAIRLIDIDMKVISRNDKQE